MKTLLLAIACFSLLAGCKPTGQVVSTKVATGSGTGTSSPAGNTSSDASKQVNPSPPMPTIPADIKTEGYEYFGLDHLTPINMRGTVTGQKKEGSSRIDFNRIEDGKAIFDQSYTGGLQEMGTTEYAAGKQGVYTISTKGQYLKTPQLMIPANPKAGYHWSFDVSLNGDSQPVEEKATDTISGPSKVTVGKKTYDALVITEQGKAVLNGKSDNYTGKLWLVKHLGAVKIAIMYTSGPFAGKSIEIEAAD